MVHIANNYYITLEEAKSVLQQRMAILIGTLKRVVYEWNFGLSKYHTILDASARGLLINQLWYHHANQTLHSDSGVTLKANGLRASLEFDKSLVLRLKHVDEAFRSWNYPTRRNRAWIAQTHFPSIPPVPRLDLGYRMDLTGTTIEDAMVIFSRKGQPLWRWRVWRYPDSEFTVVHRDMFGRTVYAYDDFSGAEML